MAVPFSTHLVPVSCDRLQPGMYVAELDRSWLHTPFRPPGLMLADAQQIEALARHCEYVYVDPAQSDHPPEAAFATGLTTRIQALPALPDADHPAAARLHLRTLAHAFAAAVRGARRSSALHFGPLRDGLAPVVAHLYEDPDTVPWLMATEMRLPFLHRRALDAAWLMTLLARRVGFERALVEDLALAGLLLDIGKVCVPVTILAREASLSADEFVFVRRHVRRGVYLLRAADTVAEAIDEAVLCHHERLDGSGYPRALRGTQIPLAGRLAALVDTYGALLLDRRYALSTSPHEALRRVHALRGRHFDTALVRAFTRQLGIWPTGCRVRLADGRIGIVRAQRPDEPLRPGIVLVQAADGQPLPAGAPLWHPQRRGDITRALTAGEVDIPPQVLREALDAAA